MKRPSFFVLLIFLFSCGGPQIDIHSPIEEQSYGSEGFVISATISDDDGIRSCGYIAHHDGYMKTEIFMLDSTMPTNYELGGATYMTSMNTGDPMFVTIVAEDAMGTSTTKKITVYKN